jgi:hypothetical protein
MFRSILAAACLLFGAAAADAHTGAPFGFAPLGGRPDVQAIAPGQAGSYAFRVTNPQASGGVAYVHAYLESRIEAVAQYTFVSPNPACGAPDVEMDAPGSFKLFFPVTLPAGGAVDCQYTVQRAAASSDDLGFLFYEPCGLDECVVRRGSFTDQSLSVVPAPQPGDGGDRLTYRLVLRNHATQAGVTRDVSTECAEFGGGIFDPKPFVVENDFPGACPDGESFEGWLNFTGQIFSSYGLRLGPAPAGGESSCLVRLRYPGGRIEPGSVALFFSSDRAALAGGAVAFDRESGNDATALGYAPNATTHSVPFPRSALALLGGVLLLTGIGLVRRR